MFHLVLWNVPLCWWFSSLLQKTTVCPQITNAIYWLSLSVSLEWWVADHSLRVFASILKYFVNFVNIPNISIQFNIFADAHAQSITRLNAKKFKLVQGRFSPSSALDGGVTHQYMRRFDLVLMMVDDSSVLTGQSFRFRWLCAVEL